MTKPAKRVVEALTADNWQRRRRWMTVMLLWFVANAQYLIIWGNDNALHQNALVTILGAIVAVMGSYVFGAVWDDNGKRKNFRTSFDEFDRAEEEDADPTPPPRQLGDPS